jgi:hypothetical protein
MIVALIFTAAVHHAPAHASRSEQRPPLHRWDAVAACESGGDWQANTGNGYYGGLQESESTFLAYNGTEFAPRPDLATEAQQIVVAERILRGQGIGAWPFCGRYVSERAA